MKLRSILMVAFTFVFACSLAIFGKIGLKASASEPVDISDNITFTDWADEAELKYINVVFGEGTLANIDYGVMDNDTYKYIQDYIEFNGRTVREINTDATLGAADWTYTVFPSSADAKYKVPVMIYESSRKQLRFKLHSNYFAMLGNEITVTVKAGLELDNEGVISVVTKDVSHTYVLDTEPSLEEVDITSNVSAANWVTLSELRVTYLNFGDNVIPDGVNYDVTLGSYAYVQDYILINGKSVREINADTTLGAADWTYTVFPATADARYKIPVVLFANTSNIEIKIHSEYVALLGNKVEITAKAGLQIENDGKLYKVTRDVTNTVYEKVVVVENDITEGVSINNWTVTGDNNELTYSIITFAPGVLPAIGYGIIDNAKYQYLQEYITVNGKTVAEINSQTDTSSYEFSTFPSTIGAPYNVPVVIFENGDTLEIKVHNDYIASLGGNVDVTIGIKAGAYFAESETLINVVKSDVQELVRRKEYTLTLINGDGRAEIPLAHGSAINLEDQVRVGYTFEGWLEYETDSAVLATMPERDYTVYVVYTAIEYTVTFVAGEETVATKTYTVENVTVEEPTVPEKAHYTGAWEEYTLTTGNVTVNAIYTAIEYTVTFVADGEEVGTATYTVENKEITEPTVPAKEGYTTTWAGYELTLGDVTVNAVYTAIEYTVTFVVDGVEVGSATYTVENKEITEPTVPAKEGYTATWAGYELTLGDVTVNAVYTAIEYTVTFVADGVEVGTATYTVENKEITVPTVPTKEGYTATWAGYELTLGDVTVNAVYTKIEETESESEIESSVESKKESVSQEESKESLVTSESVINQDEEGSGCMGSIGGTMAGLFALAGLAVVRICKGKKD